MTAVATKATTTTAQKGIDRGVMAVFAGLMLGSLIASLNMTLVAPALPTIVAELGGLADYSWIPISAMLASTIVVPVAGKLSDIYGRKPLYMTGIVVFAVGSALSGIAPNFWFLVFARFVQGAGMGFIMPLSQAIIGDIISPRERGKYQGMMGASFGLASIVGPAAGGFITEHFTWRWLFFVNLPIAILTLIVIWFYMHVPNERRKHAIDVWGSVTLSGGITCLLLGTVWGGVRYPWASWQIVGLYAAGAILLAGFVWVEMHAPEPVLPLRLWKSSIFTFSNIASIGVAMAMFGAIFFLPVFVQGVIGNSVTNSGAILVPMLLAMIVTSVAGGQFISRTGRYKVPLLIGLALMGDRGHDRHRSRSGPDDADLHARGPELGRSCRHGCRDLGNAAVALDGRGDRSRDPRHDPEPGDGHRDRPVPAGISDSEASGRGRGSHSHRRVRSRAARSASAGDRSGHPAWARRRPASGVHGELADHRGRVHCDPLHPRAAAAPDRTCGCRPPGNRRIGQG
ncbi:MAG: MFS transporter [Chloroflexi bacterium]|nr:MAG: MFS transporter [Chloroflexota bacterium]